MDSDEIIDLVQQDDQVIGSEKRSVVYSKQLKNFRVVNAFVINWRDEVFIPKRSLAKKLFPGCLDCSVGGHVLSGENYDQALLRETEEELGLQSSEFSYISIGRFSSFCHPVSAMMHLYLIRTDRPVVYHPNDFCEASWYSVQELQKLLLTSLPSKGDFPFLLNYLIQDYFDVIV